MILGNDQPFFMGPKETPGMSQDHGNSHCLGASLASAAGADGGDVASIRFWHVSPDLELLDFGFA